MTESPDTKTDLEAYCVAALFSAPAIALAILGGKLIGGVIPVLVGGIVVGPVIGGITYSIISGQAERKKEAKKAAREKAKAEKEAAKEEKRRKEEEYERSLSFEARLEKIENESEAARKENSTSLSAAQRAYSKLHTEHNKRSPEDLQTQYMADPDADDVFNSKMSDALFSSGVDEARERVEELQTIGRYYAARYSVTIAKAKSENDKYTANRKKAIVFAEQLSEIWEKLTEKQKQRRVDDAAESLHIGKSNIKIPDSLKNIETLSIEYSAGRQERFTQALSDYPKFKKAVDFNNAGANAAVFAGALLLDNLGSRYENNADLKHELELEQGKLYRKIKKIQESEVKADAFADRAREINMALEKGMEAYSKLFASVYEALYPAGDVSKSKEARQARKDSGASYFIDDEAEAVIQLGAMRKFLLNTVDTKFEGEQGNGTDGK
jgi:hypothetical protein